MPEKGYFITFEGIDGCGKTTQAKRLAPRIGAILTEEPYQGVEIRRILREEADAYSNAEQLAQLFIEDRKKHIQEFILPRLELGRSVVSDRYDLSTIAYQSAQGMDMGELIEMHNGLLVPDMTFLVVAPLPVCLQRSDKLERKFEADPKFQRKVFSNYKRAASKLSKTRRIEVVDSDRPIEQVVEDVFSRYIEFVKRRLKDPNL